MDIGFFILIISLVLLTVVLLTIVCDEEVSFVLEPVLSSVFRHSSSNLRFLTYLSSFILSSDKRR